MQGGRWGPGYPANGGYYGRRRDTYRDQQIMRILMALVQQVMLMERKPPITLLLAAVNVLVFLKPAGIADFVPSIRSGCLQPAKMLYRGQWDRLLWAPFLHGDEMHLYYNMASLLWKGSQLEPSMGPVAFTALIAELSLTSGLLYTAAAYLSLGWALGKESLNSCAVGFSAVLFGLKVVLNAKSPGWTQVAGFQLPTKYAAWAELFLIQVISPEASFLGHLCGIAAGMLHVYVTSKFLAPLFGRGTRRRGGGGGGGARRSGEGQYQQQQHQRRGRTWGHGTWG